MSTTRTARRLITLSAAAALIATAPGFVGVASANDTPSPKPAVTHGQSILPTALVTAIRDARAAFKVTARTATETYRTAKAATRSSMAADANLSALHVAKNAARQSLEAAMKAGTATPELLTAYTNAKTALETAKTAFTAAKAPYLAQDAAARSALTTAITAAKAVYVAAVKAAFAANAPKMDVPANLLQVTGNHHGFAFGHLNVKPNKAADMHSIGGSQR